MFEIEKRRIKTGVYPCPLTKSKAILIIVISDPHMAPTMPNPMVISPMVMHFFISKVFLAYNVS